MRLVAERMRQRGQLLGLGQRIVVLFHLQMVVAHLGGGAKRRYLTTLLCQVATAFCAIPCIRHGAPLLLGAHLLLG